MTDKILSAATWLLGIFLGVTLWGLGKGIVVGDLYAIRAYALLVLVTLVLCALVMWWYVTRGE